MSRFPCYLVPTVASVFSRDAHASTKSPQHTPPTAVACSDCCFNSDHSAPKKIVGLRSPACAFYSSPCRCLASPSPCTSCATKTTMSTVTLTSPFSCPPSTLDDQKPNTRLWHLARMEQKSIFDETWISDSTCVGHNEYDVQPFHDLFLEEQVSEREGEASSEVPASKKYYTNGELYGLLHPSEMNLPYVYDNFEWPHCDVSLCFCCFCIAFSVSVCLHPTFRLIVHCFFSGGGGCSGVVRCVHPWHLAFGHSSSSGCIFAADTLP